MPTRDTAAFLERCALFRGLPAREIDGLAAAATERRYRPREYVFMEGDPARSLCIVREGRVKIVRHARGGRDVVLELLGPGDVFGGVAVFEQRPYPASAQAAEPAAVVHLRAEAMVALGERHPALIKEMALIVASRLRAAHDSVTSLAADPVEARLAAALLRLGEREGRASPRGVTLPFHLTRQTLADMTGTTVESTIRIVSRWVRDGLLAEEGGRFVLAEPEALRERAQGAPEA